LTLPAPQPVENGKRRKGDDEKGRGGIRAPFRATARRIAINFRRMARIAFKGAKQGTHREPPPVADDGASPVSDSLDYFWQQHWQNDMGGDSIEVAETGRDFSGDYDAVAWPSPDL
jgi:hypothetical protein